MANHNLGSPWGEELTKSAFLNRPSSSALPQCSPSLRVEARDCGLSLTCLFLFLAETVYGFVRQEAWDR